ncbi:MAG TPA: hypothetical protein VFY71_12045 [Planctomycetota bacterium]|nr:hypothetical protein [Planctomycetota bacterium]
MTTNETKVETQPAPEPADLRRPRSAQEVAPGPGTDLPSDPVRDEYAGITSDPAAQLAPAAELAPAPDPAAEPPPMPTRRAKWAASTAAVTVPRESALPGVRSAEIRAELARRERRAAKLLAERERIVAEMEAIEAALTAMGE